MKIPLIQISLVLFILGFMAFIYSRPQFGAVQNPAVYPNSQLTPGKADTLVLSDIVKSYNGLTYSQSHRNVPQSEKDAVKKEYGITTQVVEIDHFFPVCAGASNDISNLWAEPEHVIVNGKDWGFHTKDKMETWVCSQIKKGKLDPKVAFQGITMDWVAFYKLHQSEIEKTTFGETTEDLDGDSIE